MTEQRNIKVVVSTFNGEEPEGDPRHIDMCDSIHANWLRKHIFWAACNGFSVKIEPEEGK